MKYMIHCCPKRMWYVEEYLIPSMIKQNISKENIIIWNDTDNVGNQKSWYNSCQYIKKNENKLEGMWHIQDDVLICKNFYSRTKKVPNNINIRCGFATKNFNKIGTVWTGAQPITQHWMSFQCIYIPNRYMREFINWYDTEVIQKGNYKEKYEGGNDDDFLFFESIITLHPKIKSVNITPCLVEHIDYLIGGSTLFNRKHKQNRAFQFDDMDLVDELEMQLKHKGTVF